MIINGMNYYSNTLPTMNGTVDPVFKQIPKGTTCFLIWRIEKLQVTPLTKDQYGSFHTGDSYIIYSATEPRQPGGMTIKEKPVRALEQHIHFWLGSTTTNDEAGVAAYKTVELDDFLGGHPVQHRETEGAESQRFRSYFPKGIRILQGGVASGFNQVTHTFTPKLYCVKGKRRPVVRQMPNVSWSFMNSGDVFIVQSKEAMFIWEGATANNLEKLQAAKVAQELKSELGGKPVLVFVKDSEEEELTDVERQVFEHHLPLNGKSSLKPASAVSDESADREVGTEIKLYRCSDDDGTLRVTEVKTGPLYQNDLDAGDSYIVDNGLRGIWVWIGKKASPKERIEAMRNAQGFIKKKGYPNHTQVTRVIDSGEPEEFKSLFCGWKVKNEVVGPGRQHTTGRGIAKMPSQSSFDAATLHEQPKLAAMMKMIDDATGAKEVYKVHQFKLVPVPSEHQGSFFEHDCYVVKYTSNGPAGHILVYFWLGLKATTEDRGSAALLAKQLDDEVDDRAIQIRIVQGKEPPHFIALFGGEFTVYLGDADDSKYEPERPYLLQVRGNVPQEAKAIQVPLRAGSLNSNDVFVLVGENASYLWCGKGSTGDEREMAKKVASKDRVDCATMYEGQEIPEFWDEIGGKEEYASDKKLADPTQDYEPRLFHITNATGAIRADEIVNFNQQDLIEDDVILLDIGDSIFLWFGKDSNKTEQQGSIQMAQKYLSTDPTGRDADAPILIVKQGLEPPTFTGFFGAWDRSLWNHNQTYEQLKAQLKSEQAVLSATAVGILQTDGNSFETVKKYSMDKLKEKDSEKLPSDVNPSLKEIYLSEDDFDKTFHMSHKEFTGLPQWKRTELKKAAGLF